MNDFTKEELKIIFKCMDQLYDLCEAELLDKIQSLIDNYCEHKNREPGYDEENGHHVYCTNCYKVYDVENK